MTPFLNKVDSICRTIGSCGRGFWVNLVLYCFFVWEAMDVGRERDWDPTTQLISTTEWQHDERTCIRHRRPSRDLASSKETSILCTVISVIMQLMSVVCLIVMKFKTFKVQKSSKKNKVRISSTALALMSVSQSNCSSSEDQSTLAWLRSRFLQYCQQNLGYNAFSKCYWLSLLSVVVVYSLFSVSNIFHIFW